jgi:hypothetical protein
MRAVAKKIAWSVMGAIASAVVGLVARVVFQTWGILDPFSERLGGWLKMHVTPMQAGWTVAGIVTFAAYAALLYFLWRSNRLPQLVGATSVKKSSTSLNFTADVSGTKDTSQPDIALNDAVNYIANDSKTIFDKPSRPETPRDFPPGAKMAEFNTLEAQARRQLSDKINIGVMQSWGRRQINAEGSVAFESSFREIPTTYWDDMKLDFHSAKYYNKNQQLSSQTLPITGKTETYNWAGIALNRAQIEKLWPRKGWASSR